MTQCRSHHPVTIHDGFKQRFVSVIKETAGDPVDNPPATACPTCRIVDLQSGARVELWNRSELWKNFAEQHGSS